MNFTTILLFFLVVIAFIMIVLSFKAQILPPGLTGMGFLLIALLLNKKRKA